MSKILTSEKENLTAVQSDTSPDFPRIFMDMAVFVRGVNVVVCMIACDKMWSQVHS